MKTNWLTKSLSSLLLPSNSTPGVFEDMDVPETFGDGVGRVETSQRMFPASLKTNWLTKSLSSLLLCSKSTPGVWEHKEVPETLGDGVGKVETSQGMFPASLKIIG